MVAGWAVNELDEILIKLTNKNSKSFLGNKEDGYKAIKKCICKSKSELKG
jgi:hypothetical protein